MRITICSKTGQWASVARRIVMAVLLGQAFLPADAAEPERLSESALQQIRALQNEKQSRSAVHRKLDSQLVFQLRLNHGQSIAPGLSRLKPDLKLERDGRVLVDMQATVTPALLTAIQQAGGTVLSSFPRFNAIRAILRLDQIETLAAMPEVKSIRRAVQARTNAGTISSEGDATHRADFVRNFAGVSGAGIKIGVLSDSVDFLSDSQANGELGNVTVLPGQSGLGYSGEGTAMLEIIHDLAPDAELYFATAFSGEASFAQNILNLRSNGCDIIVDDVYYFAEPPFQDGVIAQAINAVTASGALYFSAAGNDGNLADGTSCTWEGDFVDGGPALPPVNAGGGRIHSFGAANFNTIVNVGYGIDLFWADPLGASSNDYDLFLLDASGNNILSASLDLQDGTQDPYENLSVYPNVGDRVVIVKASGEARFLHLVTSRGALSAATGGATRGHSAAAAALGVAAVNAATSFPNAFLGGPLNPVELFSSDGPRRIFFNPDGSPITPGNFSATGGAVLQKPDLAAADGVSTSLGNFDPFFGTSAAAPHAAAIAALIWSHDRSLAAAQVRSLLLGSALDIESPGVDVSSGVGLVMADKAFEALPPSPHLVVAAPSFIAEYCPNNALDPGEKVTVSLTLTNFGGVPTTNLMVSLLNSGGITSYSPPQAYGALAAHGGTASRNFSLSGSGNCPATNVATLHLQDGALDLGNISYRFNLGKERSPLSETFESVLVPALPNGWFDLASIGGSPWITVAGIGDGSANAANLPASGVRSDHGLTTPSLPITTDSARLTFRHRFDTSYGYNGGVLEISTNGVNFTDILFAGGSFASNGYFASLYTGYSNPLEGRLAWTGYSGNYITTIVNLPASVAGQNIRLRWRFGHSGANFSQGWIIDSISLSDGWECCPSVPNDLLVNLSVAPQSVLVGNQLTYTIKVLNTGPAPALGVSLVDVFPANFNFTSASMSQGTFGSGTSGGTLNLNLGTLTASNVATITITGVAESPGPATNRVTVSRTDADANPANNTVSIVTLVGLPALSIDDVTLLEGNGPTQAVFKVTLWPPNIQPVSVNYLCSNLTAIAGVDYLLTNGTLFFAPGVTNQTLSVPVLGDRLNDLDKAFLVTLSAPTNASLSRAQAVATLLNDDPLPVISVANMTLLKPDAQTTNVLVQIKLSTASRLPVSAYAFTSNGTAVADLDYVPAGSYLTFAAGETNKTLEVTIKSHASAKPIQAFYCGLSDAANSKIGQLGTISVVTASPGQVDHFAWDSIASPQTVGAAFPMVLTAKDYLNGLATNYNGKVDFSAQALFGNRTNTLFGNAAWSSSGSGSYTIANAFTPNVDMVVTHLRHYFGTKVSIWRDDGVLLATMNVSSTPGTWVESPLPTPLPLSAGQRYRIGVYTAGLTFYGRFDQPFDFPDGRIDQAYYVGGDGFPAYNDGWRWIFVDIKYTVPQTVSVGVSPTRSGNFTNGIFSGNLALASARTNIVLRADDGRGHVGLSAPLNAIVLPGQVTHFDWNTIASTQSVGVPFAVTVRALDYSDNVATNFTGTAALRASTVGLSTNTMLGSPTYTDSGNNGAFTLGYSFTPSTNINVTHVRHFFGSKVSIWTSNGIVVASQTVSSVPGSWRETALASPVVLNAGVTYRIGAYSANQTYYYRNDLPGTFAHGTLHQGYEAGGDGFPTSADSPRWWFVDLRYTVGSSLSRPVSPEVTGNFAAGIWNGNLAVLGFGTNLLLQADDGFRQGQSNPFNVAAARGEIHHLVWSPISNQIAQTSFPVTINAQDYLNGPATNFAGPVEISGTATRARTNSIFGDLIATSSGSGTYTIANAFTPKTNLLVTHVRHYSGTKVSIWTDAGTLLASRAVISSPGNWTETPLITPVQLVAGQRYRIGVYTAGLTFYGRFDQPADFTDGIINQTYYTSGDGFPNNLDGWRWIFVDIKYTAAETFPITVTPVLSGGFSNGTWVGNATIPQPASNVVLRASHNLGISATSNPFQVNPVPGLLHHFTWSSIGATQAAGTPFPITIAAKDFYNNNVSNFSGVLTLSGLADASSTNPTPVALQPTNTGNFVDGVWTGNLTVLQPANNVVLRAQDDAGHAAFSNPFNVGRPLGQIDHFTWNNITSPQVARSPFAVTVQARDSLNNAVSNYPGPVSLKAIVTATRTNNLFGNVGFSSTGSGTFTLGYVFTPKTNMLVTHFRHTAGTKVSIWGEDGTLLAARNVSGSAGVWTESPLSSPLQLVAGRTYRIGFYVPNTTFYGRFDLPSAHPDLNILQACYNNGDGFPANSDGWQYTLVDMRYQVSWESLLPLNPTLTGNFANGAWSGTVTLSNPVTSLVLAAEDADGNKGLSNPFLIVPAPQVLDRFTWNTIASPQAATTPFAVTLTARDAYNNPVTNFAGQLNFTATANAPTNRVLGDVLYSSSGIGDYTLSYAITPSTNLIVTHVRHYSGTKLSIWKDDGTLLLNQPINSSPGAWRETALAAPLVLSNGVTYRVGFYTANSTYYYRLDRPSVFPHGTITAGYYFAAGDAFPASFYNVDNTIFLADLVYKVGAQASPPFSPTVSGNFINGVWTGNLTVQRPATNVVLQANDSEGRSALSNPFTVAPAIGVLDHFTWNTIASTQAAGSPFSVTLTAKDFFNNTASNFAGIAALSAPVSVFTTNRILNSPTSPFSSGSGNYSVGYSFTPSNNLTVTHVRHYFGTKVSIWTSSGTLIISQNVVSTTGSWLETALTTPVTLVAGNTYVVSAYSANLFYYRNDLPTSFPNGTIHQAYFGNGDVFPNNLDSIRWAFVDLRYSMGSPLVYIPLTPTNTTSFTNGVWSGEVTLLQPSSNVVLRAENDSVFGNSNPFLVGPPRGVLERFVWNAIASPQLAQTPFTASVRAVDSYNSTVTNFNGTVGLSAVRSGVGTNTLLPAPSHLFSASGSGFTLGFNITPNTNITVTHVRHYFGSKVSIWTSGGALVVSRTVSSVPGSWVETALVSPVQLNAGVTYRVAAYTANQTYYWRNDMSSTFAHGNLGPGYEISGDAFPTVQDSVQFWLVDLRYTATTPVSAPITPTNSTAFSNGIWSGPITVLQPSSNVVLTAFDIGGYSGASVAFNVLAAPPVILVQPQNQTAVYNADAIFNLTLGPSAPVTFQWQKNGTPLPGQTSAALALTEVTRADDATYRVILSNAFGTLPSSNAALRVFVPQQIKLVSSGADGVFRLDSADSQGNGIASPARVELQATTNLAGTNTVWVPLSNAVPVVTNGVLRFEDRNATNYPRRFYRILER